MTAATIKDLECEHYRMVCEEWKEAYAALKEDEAYVAGLRDKLVELSGGERMEYGVKVSRVITKGRTDYKAIVAEVGVDQEIIEKHTGMPESTWRVTKY